jgi:hypothetical protein
VQGDWDFWDLRRSGGEWTSGTDSCGGWVVESGKIVSNWLWDGDVGGVCVMVVVPPFCGVVASSTIVVLELHGRVIKNMDDGGCGW